MKTMRLWPGVTAAAILLGFKYGAPYVLADGVLVSALGSVAAGAVILLWWLFFSRVGWRERIGILALMVVATIGLPFIVHPSIAGGMMGRMPYAMAMQMLPLALVIGAIVAHRFAPARRTVVIAAAILIQAGSFALIRTDGLFGGVSQLTWRWSPTAEDRLLAQAQDVTPPAAAKAAEATPPVASPASSTVAETAPPRTEAPVKTETPAAPAPVKMHVKWAGFRGAARDSVVRGMQIRTDWTAAPPVELWRRSIGPGWSSFAVGGDLLFTQEQRGGDEIVAAYHVGTGRPAWMHKDPARFYESNGGAGPRGTPTLSDGRLYAVGATGILNVLDAATGARVWKRDIVADSGIKLPGWGITSSPLVHEDVVVVAASGALLAYDRASGDKRWFVKSTGGSYSSPHLIDVNGSPQIVLLAGAGATGVSPKDGSVLWRYPWSGTPMVQPTMLPGGDILVTTADMMGGLGIKRLSVTRDAGGWKVEERWTSNGLKPYFNDYVVHKGHVYGYDGSILACVSLEDGTRKWKGGRYGQGQMLLIADSDLLLVISEEGELALVKAAPDQFTEVARVKAIDGKTWNHPALSGNVLLVRNGEQMAAFRLP